LREIKISVLKVGGGGGWGGAATRSTKTARFR